MDLSLDDIIKMNKGKTRNKKPSNANNSSSSNNKARLQRLKTRSGIKRKPAGITTNRNQTTINESTMLHVSNLNYAVSTQDVRELFSDVEPVKKAEVHYDKSGRSLGTAQITFRSRDAAVKALKRYNNLPLDGRPMVITLVPNKSDVRSPVKSFNKPRVGSGIQKRNPKPSPRSTNNRTHNQKTGGKFKRQPRKEVTAEQLDAELEDYKTNKVTAMQH